jgi:hypothetical protein
LLTGEKLDLKNVAPTIHKFPKNPITPHAIAQECSIEEPKERGRISWPEVELKKFSTVAGRPSRSVAILDLRVRGMGRVAIPYPWS